MASIARPSSGFPVPTPSNHHLPFPEVRVQPTRRRFSAAYKLRIVQEADAAAETRQVGALLRREGLYASHLVTWRRLRDAGALGALGQRCGRQAARAR